MNLVKEGILNNVESYLEKIKTQTDVNDAKTIVKNMIESFNIKDESKQRFTKVLSKKRTLNDVLFFAYNMNLSAEGLKASHK